MSSAQREGDPVNGAVGTADKRVALVTGAARGLGLAIAQRLGRQGHPVVLVDADPVVDECAVELRDSGIEARSIRLDVADEAAVRALPERLGDWCDRLAILVNNAGISPKLDGKKRPVMQMPAQEWRRVLDVNLTGPFLVTQACLPTLCARGWGRIVMITSQAARTRTPVPGAHYAASKAGRAAFACVLAGEVAVHGVTVNCVAPGRIESDMTAAIDSSINAALAAAIPIGRLGRPDEVASTVAFLVTEEASYLTGATVDVNGGSFMA